MPPRVTMKAAGCSSSPWVRFMPNTPPTTAPDPRATAPISMKRPRRIILFLRDSSSIVNIIVIIILILILTIVNTIIILIILIIIINLNLNLLLLLLLLLIIIINIIIVIMIIIIIM